MVRTIELLLESFRSILERLVESPSTAISQFDLAAGLQQQSLAAQTRKPSQTMAIAGSFTCEPVGDSLGFWMEKLELPAVSRFADYNQVFQQLLDPSSLISANTQGMNVVLLRVEDWLRDLPPATIAVYRTGTGGNQQIDESVYTGPADNGSNFRIDTCQYIYNLSSSALGVGTYRVHIDINGQVVGSGIFQLK